jgi:N-acetylmuramoyl-L-alanine amidase
MIPGRVRRSTRWLLFLVAILGASVAWLVSASSGEKQISIYSAVANYSLPVVERNGQDYVGLIELLDPLGRVSASFEAQLWRVQFNSIESEFSPGSARIRVRGNHLLLPAVFLLENGRGLVPLSGLNLLLPHILGGPVSFHESGRRIFIGSVGVHFTAQANRTNPPSLVLNFTSSVNPMIATEAGRLEKAFTRDPLLPPGSPNLTFDSTAIPSATYLEDNGVARIEVNGAVPLFASFSNDGRTITVTASPRNAAPAQPAALQVPSSSAPPVPANASEARPEVQQKPKYFAVVDAAHGGDDAGATLDRGLPEKDVTLAFARRLAEELEAKGLPTLLLRDGDATISVDQRASLANSAQPAVYICLHASSEGSGVRLYTALLPMEVPNSSLLIPWNSAQSSYLAQSLRVAASLGTAFEANHVASRSLAAPLRPLNSVTTAAVAIEISSPEPASPALSSADYQQLVATSVATGLLAARASLGGGQ